MGHKVNPNSLRQGITKDWSSKWFAKNGYAKLFLEDLRLRNYITKKLSNGFISKINIKREKNATEITIFTARPGMIIGRSGSGIISLKKELLKLTQSDLKINIEEVKEANIDAHLIAQLVASQIEKRISYKRAVKQSIARAMQGGAKGIKVNCKGRLGGVEIARSEYLAEGKIPLSTMSEDIDFATASAKTISGIIGIKVWIYRGK